MIKYYRPKSDFYDWKTGYTTIKGELLTDYERRQKFRNLPLSCFDCVEYNRNEIFKSFGVRFPISSFDENGIFRG